jgi:hypothetical protein
LSDGVPLGGSRLRVTAFAPFAGPLSLPEQRSVHFFRIGANRFYRETNERITVRNVIEVARGAGPDDRPHLSQITVFGSWLLMDAHQPKLRLANWHKIFMVGKVNKIGALLLRRPFPVASK